jgi:hypothetical protein
MLIGVCRLQCWNDDQQVTLSKIGAPSFIANLTKSSRTDPGLLRLQVAPESLSNGAANIRSVFLQPEVEFCFYFVRHPYSKY